MLHSVQKYARPCRWRTHSKQVPGLASDKGSYGERWDALMPLASDVFNKLLERGPRFPRNFILDQTNVYPSARARKMRGFQGFRKVAVVVVPDEGVLQDRTRERAQVTGKAVPQDAVDEMKGECLAPCRVRSSHVALP